MTQTIQVETCTSALPAAKKSALEANSPGAEAEGSSFAQLLAIAQNLFLAGEQTTPAPTDSPLPEQRHTTSAGEIEQVAASLGLPLFTANMPSVQPVPLPEAHTSDAETSRLPVQMAILPRVATDAPIAVSVPADNKVEPEAEAIPPSLPYADGALVDSTAQKTTNPTQPAQQIPPVATVPPQGETAPGDITSSTQTAAPPAPEAQNLPSGVTETPRLPSEVSPTAPGVHTPAVAPAQAGHTSQTQSEIGHDRQGAMPTTSRNARPHTKKQAVFEVAERLSPSHLPEAHAYDAQGAQTASAIHRTREAVIQPAEVSPAEVVRQVARQIETMTSQRSTSSVTLQLEPEHLGRLRVTISFSDGAIHTHIVADNHAVRQMLESNSALLQQALQERGLQLGALQVSVQGDGRQFFTHQPYTSPSHGRGWLEAEPVWSTAETNFGRATPGGVNLLV